MRIYIMTRKGVWLFDNESVTPVFGLSLTNWQIDRNILIRASGCLTFVQNNERLSDPPAIMSGVLSNGGRVHVHVPNTQCIPSDYPHSIESRSSAIMTREGLVSGCLDTQRFMCINDEGYATRRMVADDWSIRGIATSENCITTDIITGDLITQANARGGLTAFVRYADQRIDLVNAAHKRARTTVAIGQTIYAIGSNDVSMLDWRINNTHTLINVGWYKEINESRPNPLRLIYGRISANNTRAAAVNDTTIAIACFPVWPGGDNIRALQTINTCMLDTRWPVRLLGIYPEIALSEPIGSAISACLRV